MESTACRSVFHARQRVAFDSISFVSFIVKLEEVYKITFPDEILILESIRDIDNLSTIIEQQMEERNEFNN